MSDPLDLLGPASAVGAVTARPTDSRIFGASDTWFTPCTSPDLRDGTQLQAVWLNGVLGQFRYALRAADIPLDNADDGMLWAAMQAASSGIAYGAASNIPTALTVEATVPALRAPIADGAVALVHFPAGLSLGTGATIRFGGDVRIPLLRNDGSPVQVGDGPSGAMLLMAKRDGAWRLIVPGVAEVVKALNPQTNPKLYVSPTGSDDTADGTTPETAFRQPRQAVLVGRRRYPLSATTLDIAIANGSYNGLGSLPAIAGTLNLIGNSTSPQSVVLSGTASGGRGVNGLNGGSVIADGLTFQNTGTASHTIAVSSGDFTSTNCRYVSAGANTGGAHLYANPNASIIVAGGNAAQGAMGWLFWANGGTISIGSLNEATLFTLLAGNAFAQSAARASDIGRIRLFANTSFPGSATGVRFRVDDNSKISVFGNGADAFPGNQAGVTYDNGIYAL